MSYLIETWQKEIGAEVTGEFDLQTLVKSREVAKITPWYIKAKDAVVDAFTGKFTYHIPKRHVDEVIVHCSATPEGKDFTVADIRRWHKNRGWSDIGYHYVVYRDGTIKRGRSNEKTGAHVAGHNRGTIGICYIGGVEASGKKAKDTRTDEQKAALEYLVGEMIKDKRIKLVTGHNKYAAKACPSFVVRRDKLGNLDGFKAGKRI